MSAIRVTSITASIVFFLSDSFIFFSLQTVSRYSETVISEYTGGNSGSQASVTVIRGLSLNELRFSDLAKVVWKEARVALLCGVTLAVCNYVKLMVIDRVTSPVATVLCITLTATVFVAKIIGCSLPMLAKKIGFDPAVMASPFITTIVDAISLMIYFTIATSVLGL